jgi:hypothetical protein
LLTFTFSYFHKDKERNFRKTERRSCTPVSRKIPDICSAGSTVSETAFFSILPCSYEPPGKNGLGCKFVLFYSLYKGGIAKFLCILQQSATNNRREGKA